MKFDFKKKDLWFWVGLIVLWVIFRLALKPIISTAPLHLDYPDYFIEGMILSSVTVGIVIIFRKLGERDEIKEKKIFGIKFVWHRNYLWGWIAIILFWGIGRSLANLFMNIPPDFVVNFIKGGFLGVAAILGAGFWEGNPEFFEGCPKGKKGKEK
jgi:hypothetical protein